GHMETIGKTAAAATVKVERAQEKMGLESERLLSVSTASLEAARESALSFARHSETLARASRDALEAADELDNAATGRRRQAFMESAKFMIESLHSLSVDLDRAIEGGVSQKAWKQFQKGDVSAFTGRLAELIGGVSLKRAQEQFTRNPEFRTYALRFLDQFEDLCAQAGRSDPSLLLESTIASGDLGKLYRFLSSAAGRAIA
ncbi:MAG: hypothetical protein K9G62_06640, partial [Alphaproteobacteria bacterium]|nr:hypothetical protein [Alphaproteobacteria bacterium]